MVLTGWLGVAGVSDTNLCFQYLAIVSQIFANYKNNNIVKKYISFISSANSDDAVTVPKTVRCHAKIDSYNPFLFVPRSLI